MICSFVLLVSARRILSQWTGTFELYWLSLERWRHQHFHSIGRSMAAESGLGRERCQVANSPRSEWQLGENLKVKYILVARLVSGLSGPECVAVVSLGEKTSCR